MNIIFFGTPVFTVPLIEKLQQSHTVVALVTTPDQKIGRNQVITVTPVKQFGHEKKIPVLSPEQLRGEVIDQLRAFHPDLIVVASYGKIIPLSVLEIPVFGAVNIHPSLLPKFRGASPIPATILNGDTVGGVTIIKMDEELDHGPIIAQKTFEIKQSDSTVSLLPIFFTEGIDLLLENLDAYASGELQPTPQNHEEASCCGRFTKEDAYIDSAHSPEKGLIDRMIRAYTPWPIAWTKMVIQGKEVRVKLFPENMIQAEGKKKMTVKEFLNGYPELRPVLTQLLQKV